jgi:hypothetical protein
MDRKKIYQSNRKRKQLFRSVKANEVKLKILQMVFDWIPTIVELAKAVTLMLL